MRTGRKRRPVWLLAAANGISATGSLAAYTALTYEVYRQTGSPYWVSTAAFVSFALTGAAAPVAGWLADRYDRRRVMIGATSRPPPSTSPPRRSHRRRSR